MAKTQPLAPQGQKRRRRFWVDPRFGIGVALVVVSLAGVWFVVSTATTSTPVYAAASTLSVGDTVTASDLVVTHVQLGEAGGRYVADGELPDDGAVIVRTILKGELVPQSSVGSEAELRTSAVVVETSTSLAAAVEPGALADIWTAERDGQGDFAPPVVTVSGASVARVIEDSGMVTDDGASVELLVPKGSVAAVLAAIARGDAVSIVPAGS
ncbi:hypothetical protein GCM10027416_05450 [Okibacterium endophyticum]